MKVLKFLFCLGITLDFIAFVLVCYTMPDLLYLEEGSFGMSVLYSASVFLVLAAIVGLAIWLKNKEKLLLANVVVWIPAIPFVCIFGFVSLFIIHDIFYK